MGRADKAGLAADVIDVLSDLFIMRGVPGHVRSDNGPASVAKAVRSWIAAVGAKTAFIEPGSPWENGYCDSFNAKLRDELLNDEIFYSLAEAKTVIDSGRQQYNIRRPHSSLGYKPPTPATIMPPSSVAVKPTSIRLKPDHQIGAGQYHADLIIPSMNFIISSKRG
jgi:transposase InsO family protein